MADYLVGPYRRHGGGWTWYVGHSPARAWWDGTEWHTGSDGRGVWIDTLNESGLIESSQTVGTGQFTAGPTRDTARAAIRRLHGGDCATWVDTEPASTS